MVVCTEMKRCGRCKEEKPEEDFWANSSAYDGLQGLCKACMVRHAREWRAKNKEHVRAYERRRYKENPDKKRSADLKAKFGITLEDKTKLLDSQNGRCAICRKELFGGKDTHVDHCHSTQKIRGILCTSCNNGLGRFKDNANFLESAINYLRGRENDSLLDYQGGD